MLKIVSEFQWSELPFIRSFGFACIAKARFNAILIIIVNLFGRKFLAPEPELSKLGGKIGFYCTSSSRPIEIDGAACWR